MYPFSLTWCAAIWLSGLLLGSRPSLSAPSMDSILVEMDWRDS